MHPHGSQTQPPVTAAWDVGTFFRSSTSTGSLDVGSWKFKSFRWEGEWNGWRSLKLIVFFCVFGDGWMDGWMDGWIVYAPKLMVDLWDGGGVFGSKHFFLLDSI